MDYSRIRYRLYKKNIRRMIRFVKDHVRYFAAGALFVLLVLMLANCMEPGSPGGGIPGEISEGFEEFEVDVHEDVNALINQYYSARATGDIATLQTIATPISAREQSYISMFSQYVDGWQNVHCYTKSGLDPDSYMVFVTMELKFTGVGTPAPGLEFYYVRTNENGALYIDNLYSNYNSGSGEYPVDASVQARIDEYTMGADVIALQNEVVQYYDEALLSDAALLMMAKTTLPDAINSWKQATDQIAAQDSQQDAEQDSQQDAGQNEGEDSEQADASGENTDDTQQTEQLATNDRVNVRAAADTNSERLGILDAGTVVTRIRVEGDWSVINFNDGTGYVRNDFLTYDLPAGTDTQAADNNNGGGAISFPEGTVIELKDTVNVRESMSETADRVGTAYAGETVTVIMSYADGWTRVRWNGQTGYIKSELLQ